MITLTASHIATLHWNKISWFWSKSFDYGEDPLEGAIKSVGAGYFKKVMGRSKAIQSEIRKQARRHSADFGYLMHTILALRHTWPRSIRNSALYALETAVTILVRSGNIASYKAYVPRGKGAEDEIAVDRALVGFSQWAHSYLSNELRNDLFDVSLKYAKPLRKKAKLPLSVAEAAHYVMVKFADKIRLGTLIFPDSTTLLRVIRLISM